MIAYKQKMLIISFDALGSIDMGYIRELPNFRNFISHAAICGHVESIYPSLTYPAHTSIVTGRLPKDHGIVNNVQIQTGRKTPDWFWQNSFIQGTTLYKEAIKKGMKVAALLWPVTGKAKIQYNLPEILPNRPWENQIIASLINGTPKYEAILQFKFGYIRKGIAQPQLDDFTQASLLYTLEKYQPDLTLVHFTDLDTNRHTYGLENDMSRAALSRHDKRLGEIIEKLKEMGLYENTRIILLGDHSQLETHQIVYPNYIFRRKGYLEVYRGVIKYWKVLAWNCDGSCYIYLKNKSDSHLFAEVKQLLEKMAKDKRSGIETIVTSQQAAKLGADPNCAFMLEAKEGFYFQNNWKAFCEDVVPGSFMEQSHMQQATHGYLPTKNRYQTVFMASGPGIKKGVQIDHMSLLDEGPTMAHLLKLDLGKVDGRVLHEILQ